MFFNRLPTSLLQRLVTALTAAKVTFVATIGIAVIGFGNTAIVTPAIAALIELIRLKFHVKFCKIFCILLIKFSERQYLFQVNSEFDLFLRVVSNFLRLIPFYIIVSIEMKLCSVASNILKAFSRASSLSAIEISFNNLL